MEPLLPVGITGILVVQAVLLWRIRSVEREQHYQGQWLHWIRDVMTGVAHKLDLELPAKPERLPP